MAFPKPENVAVQGTTVSEGEQKEYFTSMTAFIGADIKKGSGETLKRRFQVDFSLSPTGPWEMEWDQVNGYQSASAEYRGQLAVGFQTGNLAPNTVYHYRAYVQRTNGTVGSPYFTGSFLTPEVPDAPTTAIPTNESDISIAEPTITFEWDYVDQGGQDQGGSYFYWRTAPTVGEEPGEWNTYTCRPGYGTGSQAWEWLPELPCFPPDQIWTGIETSGEAAVARSTCPDPSTVIAYSASPQSFIVQPTIFPQNQRIEWKVANLNDVYDANGPVHRSGLVLNKMYLHLGGESGSKFFTIIGPTTAPLLISPDDEESVIASEPQTFEWKFRDPVFGTVQKTVTLRYKNVFSDDWTVIDFGDAYANETYLMPAGTLEPGTHYEWQAQTTNDRNEISDWSTSAFFWAIVAPGSGIGDALIGEPLGALGCGTHQAYIYDRGGEVRRGEVTNMTRVIWDRRRDDISEASLVINNWDEDCGELLASLRTWQHELVIFRRNDRGLLERVWEGPIVRINYQRDQVEVYAKDVMVYVYRRVLRQGFNDAYRLVNGVQVGLKTVVYRSRKILSNALAYDDPNIIPYITTFEFEDDARTSRVVEAFSTTAWEQIDDMAATAGLDYTTVGRRIILNDTHRSIGLLPEMRDGDFGDDPIVTEYGMQLANFFAVTNNSGVYGTADRFDENGPLYNYGYVEMLASAYGEAEGAAQVEVLTPAALAELQATLAEQAERNISGRHPAPVIVRVPDNTTLNPEVELGINQLVPGVWMPLRSVGTLRQVTQMQKLDKVVVTEEAGKETVTVTLSPSPAQDSDEEPEPEEV